MIPNELCHYTSKETALEKILFEKSIKIGQFGFTNDPKEHDGFFLPIATFKDLTKIDSLQNEVRKIGSEEWKVLCMTKHDPKQKVAYLKHKQFQDFRFGFARPRMWAQYAGNHTGICLVFDGKRLDEQIKNTLSGKNTIYQGAVEYSEEKYYDKNRFIDFEDYKKTGKETIRRYFFENYKSIFLTKFGDWKNESEYRWLIHSKASKPEYINIEGTIKYVLAGASFPEVYEPALRAVCENLCIPAGKLLWAGGMLFAQFGSIYKPSEKLFDKNKTNLSS